MNNTVKMNAVFHTGPLDLTVRTEKMSDVTGENESDKGIGAGCVWLSSRRKSPLG